MDSLPRKCLEDEVSLINVMNPFFNKLILFLKNPRVVAVLAAGCIVMAALLCLVRQLGYSYGDIVPLINTTIEYISNYPFLAYLAVLLAGGLPIPLSPVLILAAVLFTNRYGMPVALLLCYSAMVLNMIWTYFLSAYPMRRVFEKIIQKFASKFPEIPEEHKSRVALIIRITPGIPFFLQNYFLGVSRVPFGKYLLISVVIQAFYTSAFVIGGGAIFEGKAGLAIAAFSILIVFGVIVSWLRSRNRVEPKKSPSL